MNWEYFSKRRKITLEEFVSSAKNLQEALMLFAVRSVNPPTDGSLQKLFGSEQQPPPAPVPAPVVAPPPPVEEEKVETSAPPASSESPAPKKNKWGIVESAETDTNNDNA